MPSSQLKQLERELEAAAVQFSITESASTFSDADESQSTSVSEARVLSAARSVLANDTTAPVEQLLTESATHPLVDDKAKGSWSAFLNGIRRQLKPEDETAILDWGPTQQPDERRRTLLLRIGVAVGAAVVVLALGALVIMAGTRLLGGDECTGDDCTDVALSPLGADASPDDDPASPTVSTLDGADGGEQPRGGISVADPETDADGEPSADGESVDTPTTDAATSDDGATSPSTTAGDQATTTSANGTASSSGSATTQTNNGTSPSPSPSTTSPGTSATSASAARSSTTTSAVTAAPPATALSTTTTASASGPGIACSSGEAIQRLNVINVADDDVLNIRLGPGTAFTIVAALSHDASGVRVYGAERSGAWVKIVLPGTPSGTPSGNNCGWVNAFYLGASATPV